MKIISDATLANALNAWGRHELTGKLGQEIPDGAHAEHTAIQSCLYNRCPLLAWIFLADVKAVRLVEIEKSDLPQVIRFDGESVEAYAARVSSGTDSPSRFIKELAAKPEPVLGPLIGCAKVSSGGDEPLILYDGHHRISAWILQMQRVEPYPIRAYLIETAQRVTIYARG